MLPPLPLLLLLLLLPRAAGQIAVVVVVVAAAAAASFGPLYNISASFCPLLCKQWPDQKQVVPAVVTAAAAAPGAAAAAWVVVIKGQHLCMLSMRTERQIRVAAASSAGRPAAENR